MDKNDSMNKMNDQKSKVSFPVRFVCIVIIIISNNSPYHFKHALKAKF